MLEGDIFRNFQNYLGDFYSPVMRVLETLAVILLTFFIVRVGSFIIRKFFKKQKSFKYSIDSKRIDTMATLSISIFRYIVYALGGITILSDLFDIKSVLAAAGVGGIAIGLGAQSLIRDIISGFFIILEDQYVVGDLITVDNMTGTVEEMELRLTKLRNFTGDLHIIPNGEIKKLTNHTRGNKAVMVDIPVAYSSDIRRVVEICNTVCTMVIEEFTTIVEPPRVVGITELGRDAMNLRIMAKTIPNAQWEVERRIRMLIKEEFEKEKLELFYDKNKIIVCEEPQKGGANNA